MHHVVVRQVCARKKKKEKTRHLMTNENQKKKKKRTTTINAFWKTSDFTLTFLVVEAQLSRALPAIALKSHHQHHRRPNRLPIVACLQHPHRLPSTLKATRK